MVVALNPSLKWWVRVWQRSHDLSRGRLRCGQKRETDCDTLNHGRFGCHLVGLNAEGITALSRACTQNGTMDSGHGHRLKRERTRGGGFGWWSAESSITRRPDGRPGLSHVDTLRAAVVFGDVPSFQEDLIEPVPGSGCMRLQPRGASACFSERGMLPR